MNLTYRMLREELNQLTDEQLDMNVSVYDRDRECVPVDDFCFSADLDIEDVLGENHPVIVLAIA